MSSAEVVKQVVPAAELRYFDGGHFVLDEFAEAIPRRSSRRSRVRTGAARESSALRKSCEGIAHRSSIHTIVQ
jgi:hypothetical protein